MMEGGDFFQEKEKVPSSKEGRRPNGRLTAVLGLIRLVA
jgi:hypothetical protein